MTEQETIEIKLEEIIHDCEDLLETNFVELIMNNSQNGGNIK